MIKSFAKILSAAAIMILLTGSVEATNLTEKSFVEQATLTPPKPAPTTTI